MLDSSIDDIERVSLCEALDRILNKGAVVVGEVTISVANVDLIYLGLQLLITSIETARETSAPFVQQSGVGPGGNRSSSAPAASRLLEPRPRSREQRRLVPRTRPDPAQRMSAGPTMAISTATPTGHPLFSSTGCAGPGTDGEAGVST